jgi:hypothetical protein
MTRKNNPGSLPDQTAGIVPSYCNWFDLPVEASSLVKADMPVARAILSRIGTKPALSPLSWTDGARRTTDERTPRRVLRRGPGHCGVRHRLPSRVVPASLMIVPYLARSLAFFRWYQPRKKRRPCFRHSLSFRKTRSLLCSRVQSFMAQCGMIGALQVSEGSRVARRVFTRDDPE